MDKLVIVDGNSLVNRAFYALPLLQTQAGVFSNAVYGFCNILIKVILEQQPKYMVVAFDHDKRTFRNEIFTEYKANRKPMPDELRVQMPVLKEVLDVMGITMVEKGGIEADDIIGTIAKNSGMETIIISGDRDLFQLIDKNIRVFFTKKGLSEVEELDEIALKDLYNLQPYQIIELKSLMGDNSDNIPGVPGIGEITAKSLISRFENVEGVYKNLDELKPGLKIKLQEGVDYCNLSKELATIKTDCKLNFDIESATFKFPFSEKTKEVFNKYDFKSILKRADLFENKENVIYKELKRNYNKIIIENINDLIKIVENFKFSTFIFDFKNNISFISEDNIYEISNQTNLFQESLEISDIINVLKPIFDNVNILKITFDLKSQLPLFNYKVQNIFDLIISSYLINGGEKFSEKIELNEFEEMYKLHVLRLKKDDMESLFYNIEMPLVYVLFDMEKTGFKIDINSLNELNLKYSEEIKLLTDEIQTYAGEQFNLNSPKQLGNVLFEKLELSDKFNKKHSTSIDYLTVMQNDHPIIPAIIRYRLIQKLKSTYIDTYINLVEKQGDIIHTVFNQTLTSTGRLSSSEPNLQNIPIRSEEGKILRKMFVSSFEGGILTTADYNQIELRLLANFAQDEALIKAYKDNKDIHTITASEIFGIDENSVTANERRSAKAVNFGIIYGISDFGLSQNIGSTRKEAKIYIERYFQKFPKIKSYMDSNISFAKEHGYSITIFNRRRYIYELNSANHIQKQFGERISMNMPLQGSASDIIKLAMIKVSEKLKINNLKSKLILQIHDELIIDTHPSETEIIKNILKESMENVVNLDVPLNVEISSGKTWLDAK